MTSRYCYCPAVRKKIGKRMTVLDRLRRRRAYKRQCKADIFPICGYNAPVYPGK